MLRTTYMAKPDEIEHKWYIIDAAGVPLGRLASVTASILRGKNKPTFTPNVDTGDNVIVINASEVALTGRKAKDKMHYHHTQFIGGIKQESFGKLRDEKPDKLIEQTVKGMLPHGTLGRKIAKKLHVYAGEDHKHDAQKPEVLDINNLI
ncbi:50S ribosomal protein L13 [Fructilactobacillus lindneri]|nr:50S ribosomal protein L13 [Fructilactobacillus lindneri]POH24182.1 50S ribosomal protein L13 [Fructilactobacillus lindneri DSM 20690 = JCM 11027]ANZ59834.1 50S ribosomal protein L13 [Fructilactobacillus lindneri]POG98321.1 50S ribosomal protein L13 [Fructilactobacillus lindneri]POH01808.1 50S ribosomal protein L13 [Fructilactobacillus lindneri]